MMGKFYITVWDPRLILSQIITTQALYYLCLGLFLVLLDFLFGQEITLGQVFCYKSLSFSSAIGRITIIAFVLNAILGGVMMVWIVERAKKCLDFTITVHIIHFVGCWLYGGTLPVSWVFLMVNIVTVIVQCLLGEYLCMHRELKEISLAGSLVMQV